MNRADSDYAVLPRVVRTGVPTAIKIRPLGASSAFAPGEPLLVRFLPLEASLEPHERDGAAYPSAEAVPDARGDLTVVFSPEVETQYFLRVLHRSDLSRTVADLEVQALDGDLFALRPYRGDLHVHTCRSDGKETPDVVAANYRTAGFDFLAITDHGQREPSREAIHALDGLPTGLSLLEGEEVHAPGNHLHLVMVGGTPGLAAVFAAEPERYAAEVEALRAALAPTLPAGVDPFEAASSAWCAREIAAQGGLSIHPHPYWRSDLYHAPLAMARHLLRIGVFDAFEGLGGNTPVENHLQIALYHEIRSEGRALNVVGSSDSHGTVGCDWFDWFSTLAFSTGDTFEALRDAVKSGRTIAVEAYPGEPVRAHGPFRLVRYAQFLLEHYFPEHRELCRSEGRLLEAALRGDASARDDLARASGVVAAYRERFFTGGEPS